MDLNRFHVISVISNSVRFRSRYHLYEKFKQHMEECGINFWTVEVAFGHRPFVVTCADNPRHLQLRTHDELWTKEVALKLLVERLPADWKSLAWVDADIEFQHWRGEKAWYKETLHALQHYKVVQLFQTAIDLGPNGEALQIHQGFMWRYLQGLVTSHGYGRGHSGYAWAITRKAYDAMGGFIDYAILGAGDNHMACAWIGQVEKSVNSKMHQSYKDKLLAFQEQCERYLRRNVGYVPGTILHHWHGRKRDRQYQNRWKILVDTQFDPNKDIKRDHQGLWQLADHGDARSIELRDRIRAYMRSRNEDSIDLE